MMRHLIILFLLLSLNSIYAQQTVFLEELLPQPFIGYTNILSDNEDETCMLLIERDSNYISDVEMTLNIVEDYLIVFTKILFDTLLTIPYQITPKSINIDYILYMDTGTNERKLLFTPYFEGAVDNEKIMDMEDLRKFENYVWNVIAQWKFHIKSTSIERCIPTEPIAFSLHINCIAP